MAVPVVGFVLGDAPCSFQPMKSCNALFTRFTIFAQRLFQHIEVNFAFGNVGEDGLS